MTKEELIEGEIYYCEGWGDSYLFEVTNKKDNNTYLGFKRKEISHSGWDFWTSSVITNLRKATKEECHQLQCSIKANKFIDYNTSMKTFNNSLIGRYLKYIGNSQSLPKYGDYFQIKVEESGNNLLRLSDNVSNCHWTYEEVKNKTSKHFELMPIDFIPEQQTNIMEEKKTEWVYEIVTCTTKEECDYVLEKIGNPRGIHSSNFLGKSVCFNSTKKMSIGTFGTYGIGFSKKDSKHYSFQEWCERFGHKPDFIKPIKEWSVGSYCVALKNNAYSIEECSKGDIFIKRDDENYCWAFYNNQSSNGWDCEHEDFKWFLTLQEAEIFSKSLNMKEEKWIPKAGDWIYLSEGCGGRGMLSDDEDKVAKIKDVKNGCLYLDDKSNNFRTTGSISVREQDIRKALPSEIPNNNIPEYVECVHYVGYENCYSKIYNTKTDNSISKLNDWETILIHYGRLKDGSFIESNKEAYEAQFQQYPLTKEECYSSEIEIGDEVFFRENWLNFGNSNCYKYINLNKSYKVKSLSTFKFKDCCGKVVFIPEIYDGYIPIEAIYKKNQTTIAKKVDVSSPKVGNKLLLFKKRESTSLPNVERTKLKIFKQKLIKI